ncbi:hypothetical protein M427DRAFT_497285 [Gonapodya prolifera JEL478]|uniref:Uncharacterized protein n=1 Tax=Gonapodya prolifera (strain JEL478) TaxID=1344416 RepID=A0A139AFP9_GONPJ|nr:hypothetical protein M427DRAFT_497285 [Gonapodya prolifera JEL478]|eukprot:KXS15394.1 hypothetical protein M427DRAFT_497285 [Gonapodya prolifera JEL478]
MSRTLSTNVSIFSSKLSLKSSTLLGVLMASVLTLTPLRTDLGYSTKASALRLLLDLFQEHIDYVSALVENPSSGRPSVNYRLTLKAAELFALQANTPQGAAVRSFFVEVFHLLHQYNDVQNAYNLKRLTDSEMHNRILREHGKKSGVYVANLEYCSSGSKSGEFIKVGSAEILEERTKDHLKDFYNFHLIAFYESKTAWRSLENLVKRSPPFKSHQTSLVVDKLTGRKQTEIVCLDPSFTRDSIFNLISSKSKGLALSASKDVQLEISRERSKQESEKTKQLDILANLALKNPGAAVDLARLFIVPDVSIQSPVSPLPPPPVSPLPPPPSLNPGRILRSEVEKIVLPTHMLQGFVSEFLKESVKKSTDPFSGVSVSDMTALYTEWCRQRNVSTNHNFIKLFDIHLYNRPLSDSDRLFDGKPGWPNLVIAPQIPLSYCPPSPIEMVETRCRLRL